MNRIVNALRGRAAVGLLVVLVAVATLAVSAGPAQSAFPGTNGKIAFVSDRDGNYEIYTMNADGTGQQRLTFSAGIDEDPRWSADGGQLAFTSAREGNSKIFRMNADGSDQRPVTDAGPNPPPPHIPVDRFPAWAPDGTKLAFARGQELWRVNADGTGLAQLTTLPADGIEPVWSPDGAKIAFTSGRDGDLEIYVMNADGTSQDRLTTTAGLDAGPAWSPDGSRIAYQSGNFPNADIYVMNADGTGQMQLTFNPAFDSAPEWSPDGTKIVFQSNRDGDFEIFVMNVNGTGQQQVTFNTAIDRLADWQPLPAAPGDTTPPVLTVPADVEVDATTPAGAPVAYTASATDDVDPAPVVSCAPTSGSVFPIGTTQVACTATDAAGNSDADSFTITVVGASGQLDDLLAELSTAFGVPPGLRVLLGSLDPSDPTQVPAVCDTLALFVTVIEAQTGRRFPEDTGAAWIADANRIRAVLGC